MSVVRRLHGDEGQVLVMVALMMVGVVSVVGLSRMAGSYSRSGVTSRTWPTLPRRREPCR